MSHAKSWKLRHRSLHFGQRPAWMGILNVTPDSFSDGGNFFHVQTAIDQALKLEDEGADILDIGGESTRPYSDPVAVEDELRRVVPVLEGLQGRVRIPISIDTTKSKVAEAAIDFGAEIINDVSALNADPEMLSLAVRAQVAICAMHMQGNPQNMQDEPTYEDVVGDIHSYLAEQDQRFIAAGIDPERICLDPGIGFGKTHEHNFNLLRNCEKFHSLGRPILAGHSRKGFIAKSLQDKNCNRDPGTIGVSLALALQGIQILRVHNVASNRQAMNLFLRSISDGKYFRELSS